MFVWIFLLIPIFGHCYYAPLPDIAHRSSVKASYPFYLDINLKPAGAWAYLIQQIWPNNARNHGAFVSEAASKDDHAGSDHSPPSSWSDYLSWENDRGSLRLEEKIGKSGYDSLTVIIEARSDRLVTLVPVTFDHLLNQKVNRKAPLTSANYPHIIQIYFDERSTCEDAQVELHRLLPEFVQIVDVQTDEKIQLYSREGRQEYLLIPTSDVCSSLGNSTYSTVIINYTVAASTITATQQVDIIFGSSSTHQLQLSQQETTAIKPAKKKPGIRRHIRKKRGRRASTHVSFPTSVYTVEVLEEQLPPLEVIRLNVSNLERYTMTAILDSRSQPLFHIDPRTAVIKTEHKLDRESIPYHNFRVTAVAKNDRSVTATATLNIKVVDINDHSPEFEKSDYEVSVAENAPIGTVIITVYATDRDEGLNGQVTYSLVNSNAGSEAFQIDARSGIITTNRILDRDAEQLEELVLYVKAEDEGRDGERKSSIAKVRVRLIDVNDETPRLINSTCFLEVSEGIDWKSQAKIAQLQAEDNDAGLNGQIRYSIIGGNPNGLFQLDAISGELKVTGPLDYDSNERAYRLLIRIQDLGSPPRSNTSICDVKVLDINDNKPEFSTEVFSVSVSEDVHIGFPVVQTRAYDRDDGPNGHIIYSILSGAMDTASGQTVEHGSQSDLPFIIDMNSGWITTSAKLDREHKDKYELRVQASDLGVPPQSSIARVIITVLDVPDNSPVFEKQVYNVSISESTLPGSQILTVRATDRDLNARLTYKIIEGHEAFSIVTDGSGQAKILLTKSIYRTSPSVDLIIEVTDEAGGQTDRARVSINIQAANHRPQFLNAPYRIQIPENIPLGATVIQLKAQDDDFGENGRLAFQMTADQILHETFKLNPDTGEITTRKLLDRESHTVFMLPVTVSDHGEPSLSDFSDVLIELTDVNDNPPEFLQKSYSTEIKENAPVGSSLLTLSALDPDFGMNGLVRYAFIQSANDTFTIDSTLGIIRTNRNLDREKVPEYKLLVAAIDRGEPPLSSTVTVTVKVLDVNDNPPVFLNSAGFPTDVLTFHVAENASVGSAVGELMATDADEGINGIVQYQIIGGTDADSFTLVTRPNRPPLITNLIPFDHESPKKHYKLVVRASSPPLQTDVSVDIVVTDINDNAPVLKDFRIIFNNYPQHFPTGPIGKVPAVDLDATAKLEYKIVTTNKYSLINIHPTTGEIRLSAALNSDIEYSANFTVQVSDGLHVVTATCSLLTSFVNEDTLTNTVAMKFGNITTKDLLSSKYDQFLKGLAGVLMVLPEDIVLISFSDQEQNVVKVSLTARDLQPRLLKERLVSRKTQLFSAANFELVGFEDSLCAGEPCPDSEVCHDTHRFSGVGNLIATDSFFFRSITTVPSFRCECPKGHTGKSVHYACDTEINLCYSNPCENNATCLSIEGDYRCICPDGFWGKNCEIDLATGGCDKNPCRPPSTCSLTSSGAATCTGCPNGKDYNQFCQLTTRSFGGQGTEVVNSYVAFPGIKSRSRFSLSFEFATTRRSGLLLFNGGYQNSGDFIAIHLTNGSVRVSFSLGLETRSATVPQFLGDGEWHVVLIEFLNKTVTVSVDDCDTFLSLAKGDQLEYHCATKAQEISRPECIGNEASCRRFLDVTGPMFIGSVPERFWLPESVSKDGYQGCLRNLKLDHETVDLNAYLSESGTSEGCVAKRDFCSMKPCRNGGKCINNWNGFVCECPHGYSSDDCSTRETEVFQLDGDGYMLLQSRLDPMDISLTFRTNHATGNLISFKLSNKQPVTVAIKSGFLWIKVGMTVNKESEIRISDLKWRTLHLQVHDGLLALFLDGKPEVQTTVPLSESKEMSNVVIGGHESLQGHPHGFFGCIRAIQLSGRRASPSFRSNVMEGCRPLASCDGVSCHTPNSYCVLKSSQATCQCKSGYIGRHCSDACSLNPCDHGTCTSNQADVRGYKCSCFANYTGQHCDVRKSNSCPATWWGKDACGPCNCDVAKGFDPRCDKLSGRCRCKENYYRPAGSDRCLECGCYFKGSLKAKCDQNGQCPCKPGVTGVRCNMCLNPSAEITENGCEVVQDSCPRSFSDGVWWEREQYGLTATRDCPRRSIGKAFRLCSAESKLWGPVDLSNCTSLSFQASADLLAGIRSDDLFLDTLTTIKAVNELHRALNSTLAQDSLFVSDLVIASNMMWEVLTREAEQTGMDLTHRQDKNFLSTLLDTMSLLLDPATKPTWPNLSGMTIRNITHRFHSYLRTITSHYASTYMSPIEITKRHLSFGVTDSIDTLRANKRQYTRASLSSGRSQNSAQPLMFYVEYVDLPQMLQNSSREILSMGRAIYVGTVPKTGGSDLVHYEFTRTRPPSATTAQCMTFSFTHQIWTPNGCSSTTENATHFNCSCRADHLVAVIADAGMNVNVFRTGLAVFLFNAIVFLLAVIINLVTFLLLVSTRTSDQLIKVYRVVVLITILFGVALMLAVDVSWDTAVSNIVASVLHFVMLGLATICLVHSVQLYLYCKGQTRSSGFLAGIIAAFIGPIILAALSAASIPERHGDVFESWHAPGNLMVYTAVLPSCLTILTSLLIMSISSCVSVNTQDKTGGASQPAMFDAKRKVQSCLMANMSTAVVLSATVLALSSSIPMLGYLCPLIFLCHSFVLLWFLCLSTPEVADVIDEKLTWLIRKRLDRLTVSHSGHKLNNANIRETYRNPGISISDSTTFHRVTRPDKDLSGSFEPISAFSTLTKKNQHTLVLAAIDTASETKTSQNGSGSGCADTISVTSSPFHDLLPDPATLAALFHSDEEHSGKHSSFGDYANQNIASIGPNFISAWNTLPKRPKGASRNPASHLLLEGAPAPASPKFSTFRPHSKNGGSFGFAQVASDVEKEVSIVGSSEGDRSTEVSTGEAILTSFRSPRRQLPDIISHEGGTAV